MDKSFVINPKLTQPNVKIEIVYHHNCHSSLNDEDGLGRFRNQV